MTLPYSFIDAFVDSPKGAFTGNPAAVVLFPPTDARATSSEFMLALAAEFNLSETAFLLAQDDSTDSNPHYGLRWFTPSVEFPMCGHATLASSHALFELHPTADTITFETMSGTLTAQRGSTAGSIQLSFPHDLSVLSSPFLDLHAAREASVELEDRVKLEMGVKDACAAFAGRVVGAAKGRLGWIVEVDSETDLKGAKIDVRDWPFEGYVVFTQAASALSGDHIHSRVLDPPEVQQEDPVTGSAHTMLAPYWLGSPITRSRLLRQTLSTDKILSARQVSARGGKLEVEWRREEGRVLLRGEAVKVMSGVLHL